MTNPTPVLEVCCGPAAFAVAAAAAGADRIELCANLVEGGTTPSAGAVEVTVQRSAVPVMMMIRPRGGDFLYSDVEFDEMMRDIRTAKKLGAAGVVFGLLQSDGRIDWKRTQMLVEAARPLSVTFHRAFDVSRDLEESLEALIEIGVDRVLTSAGRASVVDDLPRLERLIRIADGTLALLPGGGIRMSNIASVLGVPGVHEIHIAAARSVASPMTHRVPDVPMGRVYHPDEYVREEPDVELIVGVAAAVRGGQGEDPVS